MKRVYLLELSTNCIEWRIYAGYTQRERAELKGKELIQSPKNNYIDYVISHYALYEEETHAKQNQTSR